MYPHFPVAGYPLLIDNHLPRSRVRQMIQYISDGEFLDRQLTQQVTMQAVTYNPDTKNFGYTKLTFNWGGDGFVTLKMSAMGLPAVDYTSYITNRQYGLFVPDWFMVVLAVVYIFMTLTDVLRSSFHQV